MHLAIAIFVKDALKKKGYSGETQQAGYKYKKCTPTLAEVHFLCKNAMKQKIMP